MTVLSYTILGGLVAKWTYINVPYVIYSYAKGGTLVKATQYTAFEREGFIVAERRSSSKLIMRYYL